MPRGNNMHLCFTPEANKKRSETMKKIAKSDPNAYKKRFKPEETEEKRKAALREWRQNNPDKVAEMVRRMQEGRKRKLEQKRLEREAKES